MHRLSIRSRTTLIAVVTSTVIVVAFGWLLVRLLTDRLVAAGEASLEAVAADVEELDLLDLGENNAQFLLESTGFLLVLEIDDLGDVFVDIRPSDDLDGASVGGFAIDSGTGELRETVAEAGGLSEPELRKIGEQGTQQIRDLLGQDSERFELIRTADDAITDISEAADAARSSALIVGPLLILASGIVTWLVVGRALAPTQRIAAEAAAIDTATLDRRMTRGGGDEVDTIAAVLNDMLDRIEDGIKRERQFVADASHELKTPLTTARMAAELTEADAPTSPYPPQIIEEVDRMERLVDDLLQLARAPEGLHVERVELDRLIADVVAAHPARARISVEARKDTHVMGRSSELQRIIVNLIDNAIRYGNSTVVVRLRETQERVVLEVDDDGPGIDLSQRDTVFERFVRLDEGRSRNEGGSGLGLAIVRAIARRHGGDATIHESPLGGARVAVELPTFGR